MEDIFILKLVSSFVVGGLWIAGATFIAEYFGTKIGGIIGGLPSTVLMALYFIGETQGKEQLYETTGLFPLTYSLNAVLMITYVILARNGTIAGISGAISVWLLCQSLLFYLKLGSFIFSIVSWLFFLLLSYIVLEKILKVRSVQQATIPFSLIHLLWRAFFSGFIISLAVFMGRIGGPMMGSIFSAFPAGFVCTLIITARSVNVNFSRSLAAHLLMSGLINCVVFALILRFTLGCFSLPAGTAVAYLISVVCAYITYLFSRKGLNRLRVAE